MLALVSWRLEVCTQKPVGGRHVLNSPRGFEVSEMKGDEDDQFGSAMA